MKIIKKPRLQVFWQKYPEAEQKLKTWIFSVRMQSWQSAKDLKKSFPNAILIDQSSVFFEVLPNQYYLLVAVHFPTQSICIQNLVRYYLNPTYNFLIKGF